MSVPASERTYHPAEKAAFRAAGWSDTSGPPYYACGPYWPDELERRASAAEILARKLRVAAAAMRREMLTWPPADEDVSP